MNGPDDTDSTGTDSSTLTRRRTIALAGTAAAGVAGLGSTGALGRGGEGTGDGGGNGDTGHGRGGGNGNGDGNPGVPEGDARTFTVRLENVSTGETLRTTADGEAAEQPVPVSPVAWAVHNPRRADLLGRRAPSRP